MKANGQTRVACRFVVTQAFVRCVETINHAVATLPLSNGKLAVQTMKAIISSVPYALVRVINATCDWLVHLLLRQNTGIEVVSKNALEAMFVSYLVRAIIAVCSRITNV